MDLIPISEELQLIFNRIEEEDRANKSKVYRYATKENTKVFIEEFNREPLNDYELWSFIYDICNGEVESDFPFKEMLDKENY